MKSIMILAGGTGGHVFPGLAVAQYLREHGTPVVWMGTSKGLEARVVPDAGFDLEIINIQGLRGKGMLGWLLLPGRLLMAMLQALSILGRRKPSAVLALGGFVSGPGALMAWLMRKPLLIHEQNAIPGLTNRILSIVARKVLCGFPGVFSGRPGSRYVGNPVRADIASIVDPTQRLMNRSGRFRLFVVGGSLGARVLNTVIPEALKTMDAKLQPDVMHQCGKQWLDQTQEAYRQLAGDVRVTPFIDDMKAAYEWADLVVCRAGAMTIAELSAAGIASILVPFPFAVDDHQTANARFLAERKAAILVPESELTARKLADLLKGFGQQRQVLIDMAVSARACAVPDSVETIGNLCLEAANA